MDAVDELFQEDEDDEEDDEDAPKTPFHGEEDSSKS
jgi:hypothetical protein